jgi:hypothetical protein
VPRVVRLFSFGLGLGFSYKSPWGRGLEKRRPSPRRKRVATACRYQAGPQLSLRAIHNSRLCVAVPNLLTSGLASFLLAEISSLGCVVIAGVRSAVTPPALSPGPHDRACGARPTGGRPGGRCIICASGEGPSHPTGATSPPFASGALPGAWARLPYSAARAPAISGGRGPLSTADSNLMEAMGAAFYRVCDVRHRGQRRREPSA